MAEPRTPPPPESALDRRRIPLLELITRESLDGDYRHVAEQRRTRTAAAGEAGVEAQPAQPGRRWHGVRLTWIAVVVFGLLVALAAVQNSRNEPVEQETQEELISQVSQARAQLGQLQDQIGALRNENAAGATTYSQAGQTLDQTKASVDALAGTTGFGQVSGAGVEVSVDDNPNGSTSGEVRDSDLANLINGLWQAGATAIAVNGHRITAMSAPRNSGEVIRLDGVSLSPPYVVDALGDNRTLLAKFAETMSGETFHTVTSTYGMPTSLHNEQSLTLPAAPASMMSLSYASPAGTGASGNRRQPHNPQEEK